MRIGGSVCGAVFVLIGLVAATGGQAQDNVDHYVSLDDMRLAREGYITPVYEYVDVSRDQDGNLRFEVGYQHTGSSALSMLRVLSDARIAMDLTDDVPVPLGQVDIASLRRIGMTGTFALGSGTLAWSADSLTPTAVEVVLAARGDDPRPSPFQSGAAEASVERRGGTATELGDKFGIVVDGQLHEYRRMDAQVLGLSSYLAWATSLSVSQTRACLAPMAQAYLNREIYRFSEQAIAVVRESAAGEPALALIEQHGYGVALNHFLDHALPARAAINSWLVAQADIMGVDDVLSALEYGGDDPRPELEAWEQTANLVVMLYEGFHILPGDPDHPADLATLDVRALHDRAAERYASDPWAETGPRTSAYAGGGWATLLWPLLAAECAR